MNITKAVDIDVRNVKKKAAYIKLLKAFSPIQGSPSDILQNLGSFSVNAAVKLHSPYTGMRQLWSPAMLVICIALDAVKCIRRHCFGYHKYPKWTRDTFQAGLAKVRSAWRFQLNRVKMRGPTSVELIENFHYNWDFWSDVTFDDAPEASEAAYRALKLKLHGKARAKLRSDSNERVRVMEVKRKAGQLRHVILGLFGPVKASYNLQTLVHEGEILTDPEVIALNVKEHFVEWFRDHSGSSDDSLSPWMDHTTTKEEFLLRFCDASIPSWVTDILWDSMKTKVLPVESDLSLIGTPTLVEFTNAVNHVKLHSAGGMSGLTYNMIKCWSEVMVLHAYEALVSLWDDKLIPDYWKWKWLVPIPKVPNPTINDLRLLALVEVLERFGLAYLLDVSPCDGSLLESLRRLNTGSDPVEGRTRLLL